MYPSIRDFDLTNRRVFLRLDLNVPIVDGQIQNTNRIDASIPTINFARERKAKIIIGSHLGRPKGKRVEEYSLEPVASYLAQKLDSDVTLSEELIGEGVELKSHAIAHGDVLMLENLRFDPGEEANDPKFAAGLKRLTDIFITDAFGTAHRKHASTYGLPSLTKDKGMGFLVEKELEYFGRIQNDPARPFYLLLGGAKVSDKIQVIKNLLRNVEGVAVGGAMAFAFLKAKGKEIHAEAKQPTQEDINAANSILKHADRMEIPVVLPSGGDDEIFDISPKTVDAFMKLISNARTIFWNGPMGWFEKPEYAKGTQLLTEKLAELECTKIVGGGDTVSAVQASGFASRFDHLSTGGGAVLEFLEGKGLPGIQVLKTKQLESELKDDEFE